MLEIFNYPVSGIMKAWHLLLHNVFSLGNSASWIISIILLVITVRTLIAPITWMSIRSGRVSALMRPEKEAIEARYAEATTKEEVAARDDALRELNKRYNFKPAAGCIPPLIMFPVFIGLYRVILYMASPDNHGADANVGALNPQEIASFREAVYQGIPLTAFPAMPDDWAASMGVTGEQVYTTILPLLVPAIIFTVINMMASLYRSYWTMDFTNTLMRRMYYVMIILGVVIFPWMLWNLATAGPVPLAIVIYWFTSNLYTLIQTLFFNVLLHFKLPLADEHHEHRKGSLERFKQARRDSKDLSRRKRRALLSSSKRAEFKAEEEQRQQKLAAQKARKRELQKTQNKLRAEIRRERLKARQAEIAEKKAQREAASHGKTADQADVQPGDVDKPSAD